MLKLMKQFWALPRSVKIAGLIVYVPWLAILAGLIYGMWISPQIRIAVGGFVGFILVMFITIWAIDTLDDYNREKKLDLLKENETS